MTHPNDETLQRWYDGDEASPRDPASPLAAHVTGCARCAGRVAALDALGDALRAHSSEALEAFAGDDVAGALLARLGLREDGAASAGPAATEAPSVQKPAEAPAEKRREGGAVLPFDAARSRARGLRSMLWPAVAVAAAALVTFSVRDHVATTAPEASVQRVAEASARGTASPATPRAATGDDARGASGEGSEVLSVSGEALRLYAVLEVTDEAAGRVLPVVWLEDDGFKAKEGKALQ